MCEEETASAVVARWNRALRNVDSMRGPLSPTGGFHPAPHAFPRVSAGGNVPLTSTTLGAHNAGAPPTSHGSTTGGHSSLADTPFPPAGSPVDGGGLAASPFIHAPVQAAMALAPATSGTQHGSSVATMTPKPSAGTQGGGVSGDESPLLLAPPADSIAAVLPTPSATRPASTLFPGATPLVVGAAKPSERQLTAPAKSGGSSPSAATAAAQSPRRDAGGLDGGIPSSREGSGLAGQSPRAAAGEDEGSPLRHAISKAYSNVTLPSVKEDDSEYDVDDDGEEQSPAVVVGRASDGEDDDRDHAPSRGTSHPGGASGPRSRRGRDPRVSDALSGMAMSDADGALPEGDRLTSNTVALAGGVVRYGGEDDGEGDDGEVMWRDNAVSTRTSRWSFCRGRKVRGPCADPPSIAISRCSRLQVRAMRPSDLGGPTLGRWSSFATSSAAPDGPSSSPQHRHTEEDGMWLMSSSNQGGSGAKGAGSVGAGQQGMVGRVALPGAAPSPALSATPSGLDNHAVVAVSPSFHAQWLTLLGAWPQRHPTCVLVCVCPCSPQAVNAHGGTPASTSQLQQSEGGVPPGGERSGSAMLPPPPTSLMPTAPTAPPATSPSTLTTHPAVPAKPTLRSAAASARGPSNLSISRRAVTAAMAAEMAIASSSSPSAASSPQGADHAAAANSERIERVASPPPATIGPTSAPDPLPNAGAGVAVQHQQSSRLRSLAPPGILKLTSAVGQSGAHLASDGTDGGGALDRPSGASITPLSPAGARKAKGTVRIQVRPISLSLRVHQVGAERGLR